MPSWLTANLEFKLWCCAMTQAQGFPPEPLQLCKGTYTPLVTESACHPSCLGA